MPTPPSLGSPPLSIEATLRESFRLYGAKLKDYAKIALWATLWLWLWLVPTIAVFAFFIRVRSYPALLGLLIPALGALLIYCTAKYQINLALITRLAFGELVDQPESIKEAQRFTQPRTWRLFQAGLVLGLLYLGGILLVYFVLIVVAVVALLAVGGPQALSGASSPPRALGAILLLILLFVVLIVLLILLSLWLGARFMLYSVAIAVEPEIKPVESIRRSWSLTKGNVWRIVLVSVVIVLAIAPIMILEQGIAFAVQRFFVGATYRRSTGDPGLLWLGTLVAMAINFGVQIVVVPLWQITGAVVYRRLTQSP